MWKNCKVKQENDKYKIQDLIILYDRQEEEIQNLIIPFDRKAEEEGFPRTSKWTILFYLLN